MNRLGYILLLIIVVAIAATSSWLLKKVEVEPFGLIKPARHDMDYFLTNFNATVMDKEGKPHYILTGTRLEHFPDDHSLDITLPNIKLFREKLSPWHVKAKQARVLNKGTLIYLNGKVSMQRPRSKTEPEVKLDTSNLTIKTDIDYAETSDAVFIQTGKHRLKAIGMRVYLADGRLELLSNVEGLYNVTH
ncbi:hypothetical protein MNBD_GAMMA23-1353 [hydrothermal vent metagenome]|uniref:Lipopolysaccharide export system protein LptC n=1 Tax=hydrothermal vent metagenome TaxID=652676 RepID=A0A3B1AB63_9ZZZZ